MDPATIVEALSDFEFDLLTVLVFSAQPLSRSAWKDSARQCGIKSRRGRSRALDSKELLPVCSALIDAEVIDRSGPSGRYSVPDSIAFIVLRAAQARGRLANIASHYEHTRPARGYYRDLNQYRMQLRLAVLEEDAAKVEFILSSTFHNRRLDEFVLNALGRAPEPSWLPLLPQEIQLGYLTRLVDDACNELRPLDTSLIDAATKTEDRALRLSVARLLVLRGEADRALKLKPLPRWGKEGLVLLEAFCRGDYAAAAELGDAAIARMKGRKHKLLSGIEGACHMLATAAVCSANPGKTVRLEALLEAGLRAGSVHYDVILPLRDVFLTLAGHANEGLSSPHWREDDAEFIPNLLWLLHELWLREHIENKSSRTTTPSKRRRSKTKARHKRIGRAQDIARVWEARARAGGFAPWARELSAIVSALKDDHGGQAEYLAGAFDPPAPWETALASLEVSVETNAQVSDEPGSPSRALWWELSVHDGYLVGITPRIRQSARAKKGRPVALARLLDEEEDVAELDAADRAVLQTAEIEFSGWGGRQPRYVLGHHSALALVGHPRVITSEGTPLSVELGTPTIVNTMVGGRVRVELRPPTLITEAIVFDRPDPDRVLVYQRTPGLDPLVSVLARESGFEVPKEGHERLARALTRLSTTTPVRVEGAFEIGVATRAADARPVVQLRWAESMLEVGLRVAPLGTTGPHVRPGCGSASLVGELASKKGPTLARCERDFGAERAGCQALLDACPVLASFAGGPDQYLVATLPDALDVLLELDAVQLDITLAWAEGQKLDRPLRATMSDLMIEVGTQTDWLGVEATLQVDDDTVLHFRDLLRKREGDRYVALGRGRFVALSDKLRRHLDSLQSLGTIKGDTLQASPAMIAALEDLAAESEDFRFDHEAQARLDALATISKWTPRLPRGFGATLRDYQREGFIWLSRLAKAGLGACLADDMGLGKTVQTLAVLCQRARQGPALVVCPTSVVLNWISEATRFAPTLRLQLLAGASDRQGLLDSLRPRDVLVCSYGLLTTEIDALSEIDFSTVVYDEAHALKNSTTQRAKAAVRINAGFRLGLTGTPVENNLGELWSLFRVLVPGLLGTRSRFDQRFAGPIADGRRERATQLRAILRTFLLRRTKTQVLDELPPRSEVTVRVEPSPKQRAFYEAVRRECAQRIAVADPKKVRFLILAEITRLRQAAIDPRLIDEKAGPRGAKIEVLIERIEQLRAEGHRALVFTQFLGSIALIRQRLEASGIEFFELDGSTPAVERSRRIEAFQAGEGDVFLLSLRAGGLGINLTGADYVFHLDPWWNPAVEDQATDRAHRIGQQRPVNVYRLVTEGTIEDKIVALHASKRQLADDVLEGFERAKAPDLAELRRLLES